MNIEKPIVLTEFPKSGGSWIVSLLGEVLKIPRRDIYVRPGFDLFEITKHPWYKNGTVLDFPTQSVIKSHELPESSLIDFDATYLHLVRDGRDVIVSKWFFDKEFCVKNGITASFSENFDEYVAKTAREWSRYISAWSGQPAATVRYELFLSNPIQCLRDTLNMVTDHYFSDQELETAVSKFTKEKFGAMLGETFQHNTFVRKGISGDWRNYFSSKNIEDFKENAGDALLSLGYELNSDWQL